jgi:DNA mismatch endonuclease, patch repair protein
LTDNLSKSQRFLCMSRNKGKDTKLELLVRSELHKRGYRFRKHIKELPGCPDIVFFKAKVAIFIDGDFWHGFRYPAWKDTLSDFWQRKIEANRRHDRSNYRKLTRMGWIPLRIWEHELAYGMDMCIQQISDIVLRQLGMHVT